MELGINVVVKKGVFVTVTNGDGGVRVQVGRTVDLHRDGDKVDGERKL